MSKIPPEEERFAMNVNIMVQAIHESVQRLWDAGNHELNPGLIQLASAVISQYDKHDLIQGFIKNSHELCWNLIKTRDENFFIKNASEVFKSLPIDKVNLFRNVFLMKDTAGKSVVPDSLKAQLWDLFDAMVKISIKYVHNNRGAYSVNTESGPVKKYNRPFFPEVDILAHATVWKMNLDFPLR